MKSDLTQNLNRQYGKFCRIAASSIFRTTNEYYDQYIGFWHVPQLGDEAPNINTIFWLNVTEPLRSWGNDARFAASNGGRNNPEAAAVTADLQNQSTMDTNTSLRRLAKAVQPKTGEGLPPPGWLDPGGLTVTARGQPKKTGGPNPGRELDQCWMNGDDKSSKWKSAPPVRADVRRL